MNQPSVRLYGYATSPFVVKVGVFLKYKQVPFDFVPVNPAFPKRQLHPFKGQRRVPVLTIGDEWRADSTPLGIWLDEVFPERPILGHTPEDTQQILAMDKWVNDELIMGRFRQAMEWENPVNALRNGWTLSRIIHACTPIPFALRKAWPIVVKRVGFVRRFGSSVGPSESLPAMRARQCDELVAHIGNGPFLGGRDRVSLADLSAYATVVMPHLVGMHGPEPFLDNATVVAWCQRVQAQLPANPLVVPDHLIRRALP
jgi:glutathione S-transferase